MKGALLAGVLLGLVSRLSGQPFFPAPIRWLGNTGAPWLLLAFFLGRSQDSSKRAALSGAIGLTAAAVSHYVPYRLAAGFAPVRWWVAFWFLLAPAVGALYGSVGFRRTDWSISVGCATLAGEAILLAFVGPSPSRVIAVPLEALCVVVLPLLAQRRFKAYALAAALTPLSMLGLWIFVEKMGRVYPYL